jgi:hypothetical protein
MYLKNEIKKLIYKIEPVKYELKMKQDEFRFPPTDWKNVSRCDLRIKLCSWYIHHTFEFVQNSFRFLQRPHLDERLAHWGDQIWTRRQGGEAKERNARGVRSTETTGYMDILNFFALLAHKASNHVFLVLASGKKDDPENHQSEKPIKLQFSGLIFVKEMRSIVNKIIAFLNYCIFFPMNASHTEVTRSGRKDKRGMLKTKI